ncbi:hypothetical protein EV128_106256 [Rhizobium azibense]|nr:hypothetical protein EV128_106256 [Rhizobium azibense]
MLLGCLCFFAILKRVDHNQDQRRRDDPSMEGRPVDGCRRFPDTYYLPIAGLSPVRKEGRSASTLIKMGGIEAFAGGARTLRRAGIDVRGNKACLNRRIDHLENVRFAALAAKFMEQPSRSGFDVKDAFWAGSGAGWTAHVERERIGYARRQVEHARYLIVGGCSGTRAPHSAVTDLSGHLARVGVGKRRKNAQDRFDCLGCKGCPACH